MSHEDDKDFEMNKELTDLASNLRQARPTPDSEFTEQLDKAVADHFPPDWADEADSGKSQRGWFGGLLAGLRLRLERSRAVMPALAATVGVLFVAAVLVVNSNSGLGLGGGSDESGVTASKDDLAKDIARSFGDGYNRAGIRLDEDAEFILESQSSAPGLSWLADAAQRPGARVGLTTYSSKGGRDVAREAAITLATEPSEVQEVANEVVEVTDKHKGIVMDSKVTDGEKGKAGAQFNLLIPTGEVESAVADLSGIANLRSRSQELTDITKPVNKTEDRISDSKAKIKGLRGELEETYDEAERAKLERKIRWERRDLNWYENKLKRLERRIQYTPVGLKVETSGDTSGSEGWGISEAFKDAGKLLGVAAGVTVVALAIAIPIGIVILIVLALNRAWVRRARNRALDQD